MITIRIRIRIGGGGSRGSSLYLSYFAQNPRWACRVLRKSCRSTSSRKMSWTPVSTTHDVVHCTGITRCAIGAAWRDLVRLKGLAVKGMER